LFDRLCLPLLFAVFVIAAAAVWVAGIQPSGRAVLPRAQRSDIYLALWTVRRLHLTTFRGSS